MVIGTAHVGHRLEVLSPAGDFDALVAAVESGADAVYFGATQFSARQYAGNFDNDELARAIDYLHVRGARAYLAINTLLYDHELADALRIAASAYHLGVDALIVQDLGFVGAVKRLIPDMELHASTQMTVHNPQGARVLADMGFKRVILARELGLADIVQIRELGGPVEVEVFVHGALCFSYSGQCLMSSMVGGRSGNRGRCAQPCRLEYSLVDFDTRTRVKGLRPASGRLLSPSDLCLIECIPNLAKAGIAALKIEGRMKRPEYVATVTRAYRWAVDEYLRTGAISKEGLEEVMNELSVTFNRGFTKAYFYGLPAPDLMNPGHSSNRGAYIGRVSEVIRDPSGQRIKVSLETDLSRGDSIEVWVSKGGRTGKSVEELYIDGNPAESASAGDDVEIGIRGPASVGDRVFKTYDADVMREARHAYASSRALRQSPVWFTAEARLGRPFTLTLTDESGNTVSSESDYVVESAIRHPTTPEGIRENLLRTGNTPFRPESITVSIDDGVMVPRSVVNECRRDCIDQLMVRLAEFYRRTTVQAEAIVAAAHAADADRGVDVGERQGGKRATPGVSVSTSTLQGLTELLEARPDRVYLSLECFRPDRDCLWGDGRLERALALAADAGIETYIRLPRILKAADLDMVLRRLEGLASAFTGFLVGGLGAARAVVAAWGGEPHADPVQGDWPHLMSSEMAIHADYSFGITNSATIAALECLGFRGWTLSPELSLTRMRQLFASGGGGVGTTEVVVHGRLPLMISEQCVVGYLGQCQRQGRRCAQSRVVHGLLDRKGYVFPLLSDQFCRMHVLNSMCMCMVESINDLLTLPEIDLYRIEGYGERNETLARAVAAYKLAIAGESVQPSCAALASDGGRGFTKGHFYRGAE